MTHERVWVCMEDGKLCRVFGGGDEGYLAAKSWVGEERPREFREFGTPAIYRVTYWRKGLMCVREAVRMDVEQRP